MRFDLDWLRQTGWVERIADFQAAGGRIGGICGGYQALGQVFRDPAGIEGDPGDTAGLGLLDLETTLHGDKTLTRTAGTWLDGGQRVDAYEIHMGQTTVHGQARPVLRIDTRNGQSADDVDGQRSADGRVWGTYLHGLFDEADFRQAFLRALRPDLATEFAGPTGDSLAAFRDRQYDLLAEHFEQHLDLPTLFAIAGVGA